MKIDRLIGILSALLQKDTVTAPYLAEQFEVSRRTINRDIEDLCRAGIPIVTRQGAKGGISIMENYKMDRTLLTGGEMQDILAGLRSLDSINGTSRYSQLMEKLSAGSSDFMAGNQSVLIDLSSWYKDSLAPKIEQIREGIDRRLLLEFLYYAPKGTSVRRVEPYYLIFRWSSWYLWGWCTGREDFRLFKLNRMDGLKLTGETFGKRSVLLPELGTEQIFPGGIQVKAVFEPECKWRLVEEFGTDCFEELPEGRLLFHGDYTNKENLVTWLLSFRDQVVLLEPEEIREELTESLERMLEKNKEVRKMRYTWIDEYLMEKKGVTKDLQESWNWIRYHVGGKMFAAICLDDSDQPYYINLKLEPAEGAFLREQYEDIIPGYYSNKLHWNSVKPDGEVPDGLLKDLLDKSYQLVLEGLTKKKQKEIMEME